MKKTNFDQKGPIIVSPRATIVIAQPDKDKQWSERPLGVLGGGVVVAMAAVVVVAIVVVVVVVVIGGIVVVVLGDCMRAGSLNSDPAQIAGSCCGGW